MGHHRKDNMTKDQLSNLPDDVRLPAEVLFDHLRGTLLRPVSVALSDEGSVAFFFETAPEDGIKLTADIELFPDSTATASVIPYIITDEGWDTYQSQDEPIELWEIEEPPPFEETISLILSRFKLPKEV